MVTNSGGNAYKFVRIDRTPSPPTKEPSTLMGVGSATITYRWSQKTSAPNIGFSSLLWPIKRQKRTYVSLIQVEFHSPTLPWEVLKKPINMLLSQVRGQGSMAPFG